MTYSAQGINLDRTIAILQNPTMIPLSDAIALIDSWQQQLQGHAIADDLGELKQAVQEGDRARISQIMGNLSESTSAAAVDLPADVTRKIEQISRLLSYAAGN